MPHVTSEKPYYARQKLLGSSIMMKLDLELACLLMRELFGDQQGHDHQ